VELHARRRGVHLQIEGGRLHRFLLVAGQPRETVGEGVGDAKFHLATHHLGIPRYHGHDAFHDSSWNRLAGEVGRPMPAFRTIQPRVREAVGCPDAHREKPLAGPNPIERKRAIWFG